MWWKVVLLVELEPQLLDEREVAEGLHAAQDPAVVPAKRGGADADGDPLTVGANHRDGPVDDGGLGRHGLPQDAGRLADGRPEDVAAEAPDRLVPGDAGDLLGGAVEGGDPEVRIDREHAVGDAVEDDPVQPGNGAAVRTRGGAGVDHARIVSSRPRIRDDATRTRICLGIAHDPELRKDFHADLHSHRR
jgi:hypothetical protein